MAARKTRTIIESPKPAPQPVMKEEPTMGDLSKNFSRKEFECPCCKKYVPNVKLIETLQTIRDAAGRAVSVISGTRCAAHNKAVGSALSMSPHMKGEAADITISGWKDYQTGALIKTLYNSGKLPHLEYCYLIGGKSHTSVHVGVDQVARKSHFGY